MGCLLRRVFNTAFPDSGRWSSCARLLAGLVDSLENAPMRGEASSLVAALSSFGSPKESVEKYECDVRAGKVLILAHGNSDMIEQAHLVREATDASELAAHAV